MNVQQGSPPNSRPGWYKDPLGAAEFRYFDGMHWTARIGRKAAGKVSVISEAREPIASDRAKFPTFALTALLLGGAAFLCSLVSTVLFPSIGVIVQLLAVGGVIFGVLGIRAARRTRRGLALSIIGVSVSGALVTVGLLLLASSRVFG
ncbi:fatty acid desaturase [Microbacterium endophyticum]|uniref:Fatty acid desaturase n=1 Tax=Microbacterium endophyticum TaxID=1526412 RepID=A0A7W4YKU8_9MICO|nr:DUF2510 domain-containing protein [Microbacterium endophyticum]MBB2974483.1 fatty acid desaturase [Microbacterium endophyticum]NIK36780.1 fatty acid desaturase [Microbacterium endophyticum]